MQRVKTVILTATIAAFSTLSYADDLNADATAKYETKAKHPSKAHHWAKHKKATSETEAPAEAAASPLTGEFTMTSNYIFRGVSQTSNLPAIQGGLTYTFLTSGIYLNLWGSNVNFLAPNNSQATVEIDTIAGIKNNIIDENFTYNISFDRYNYPKAAASYNEWIGTFTYKMLFLTAAFSPNAYNFHADSHYFQAGINYDIPSKYIMNFNNVNLLAAAGHLSLPQAAGSSYYDYIIQFTKKIAGVYSVSVAWTDAVGSHTGALGNNHLIASVIVDV